MKTAWNINAIHLGALTSLERWWKYVMFGFDISPFLVTATFFRISAVILMFTYLNTFVFVSLLAFWASNLVISQVYSKKNSSLMDIQNSTWLISCIGMFVPAYFYPKYISTSRNRKQILDAQKTIFRAQSIASLVCYMPSLIACMVIVNMPSDFIYNSDIILDNLEFNVCFGVVMIEGVISACLSLSPNSSDIITCVSCEPSGKEYENDFNTPIRTEETNHFTRYNDMSRSLSKKKRQQKNVKTECDKTEKSCPKQTLLLVWSCFVLIIALAPLICGVSFIALSQHSNVGSYVYFCLGSNGTFVVETRLLSTEKLDYINDNEMIYGYTRWVENVLLKSNEIGVASEVYPISKCDANAVTYSEDIDTEILIMTIRAWEERRENNQQESSNVVGVLLIDEDEYRPSSPLKKVTKIEGDSNTPFMFLVRPEDKKFLNQYLNHSTPVDIPRSV